jgi:penicillin-binding protein 2
MSRFLLSFSVILVGVLFIARLVSLQLFYKASTLVESDPAITKEYIYPERGFIFDRNNELLVSNQAAFDKIGRAHV